MSEELAQPQERGDLSPGAMLAHARAERHLSVPEVADYLKFAVRQIEALEADDYPRLPGITIVRGMIRGYAKLLGIDPVPVLKALEVRGFPARASVDLSTQRIPFPDRDRSGTRIYGVLSVILLLAVGVVLYEWHIVPLPPPASRRPAPAVAPPTEPPAPARSPVPGPTAGRSAAVKQQTAATAAGGGLSTPAGAAASATTNPLAASSPKSSTSAAAGSPASGVPELSTTTASEPTTTVASGPAKPAATPAPAVRPAPTALNTIELDFQEKSWVEIKDKDGKVLLLQLNAAGTQKRIEGQPPFSLVIGNASHVRVTYKGKPFDLKPYMKTDVARFTLQ